MSEKKLTSLYIKGAQNRKSQSIFEKFADFEQKSKVIESKKGKNQEESEFQD
jgi:Haemolysin-III related